MHALINTLKIARKSACVCSLAATVTGYAQNDRIVAKILRTCISEVFVGFFGLFYDRFRRIKEGV